MEEPIENFLEPERKPLTQQGEKEAMKVAWKLRDVAKEKIPKGKDFAMVIANKASDTPQRVAIYSGREKVEMHKPENPKTDLVIMVSEERVDEDGNVVPLDRVVKYFFAPDEVLKKEFGLKGVKSVSLGRLDLDINIGVNKNIIEDLEVRY